MQSDRDLLTQALGYMESVGQMDMHPEEWAIAVALRERLAQPEFDSALQSAAMTQTAAKLAQPEQPTADEIIASHAKRLALELEGVLLECEETSATSKWWGSAYQAIHNFHDDVDRLYPQDHVSPLGKD